MYHVQKAEATRRAAAPGLDGRVEGLRRATLVGRDVGSVHTGFALVALDPGGWVGTHVHSTEQSFYILRGHPQLTLDGRSYRLAPDECGLIPVGVPHAWRAGEGDEPLFLEMNSPAPRLPDASQPDTFWTGEPVPEVWSKSSRRVRWLETQAPQQPANHSYRFNRDWDHLAEKVEKEGE